MTKFEGDFNLIKSVLSKVMKDWNGTTKWEDDNTVVFTDKKKAEVGKILLKDLEVDISTKPIEDLWKATQELYTEKTNEKVLQSLIDGTPLKELLRNNSNHGGIDKKPEIVKKLIAEFKKLKISEIKVGGNMSQNNTIKNDLTILFGTTPDSNVENISDSGYFGRLRTFLFDTYKSRKKKEDIYLQSINKFRNLEGETSKKIEFKGMIIGEYYNERNLVTFYFNPFKLQEYNLFDDEVPLVFLDLLAIMEEIGVKKCDTTNIQEKIFVTEFLKSSRDKLINAEGRVRDYENNVSSYERQIRIYLEELNEGLQEVSFIQQLINNKGKGLYAEVLNINKLPFVEIVKIEGAQIDIKFKPSFLPLPNFKRNDSGKSYGKRFIWIGSIGFKIRPGNFEVYGDIDVGRNHCHTHGSGFPSGSPCLGDGDGRRKIYDLLSSNKFVDLAKMLWFWVKTHKNDGAYVKCWDAYDSVLSQGYPVFDDKGKRILLNDPERIKSGEQNELEKKDNYEENVKKFSKAKLEA